MRRRSSIAEAMMEAGASVRARPSDNQPSTPPMAEHAINQVIEKNPVQPSRQGKAAITGHFPPYVRQQLKLLAVEEKRTMEDMLGEALNRLFSAYGRPEIAPCSTTNLS